MTRLHAGERACQAKKWVEAIDQLRIACFGLLDQPLYLSEGLAVLALAQNGAGKAAAVDTTLGRFVEVEQLFGVWAKVPLQRDVRAEFETLLTKRVRPEVLLTVPTLAGLVETEEQRIAKLSATPTPAPTRTPTSTRTPAPSRTPPPTRTATSTGTPTPTVTATRTLTPTGTPAPTLTATRTPTGTPTFTSSPASTPTRTAEAGRSLSLEGQLAEARELVKGGKAAEAKGLLAPLVKADPKNREAGKLLLEAALLTRDWKLCAAQAAALEPFADGEEPSMFYAAVGLYETGNLDGARTLLARARPGIAPAPFVDYYSKKILGK